MSKSRKQIAFDLDTGQLKNTYCNQTGKHYTRAYYDLRSNLLKKGFIWRQGSVYESAHGMTFYEVSILTRDTSRSLPWFSHCTRDIVATNIGVRHSLMSEIRSHEPMIEPKPQRRNPESL